MKIRPMTLGSLLAFIASLTVTALMIALFGLIVGSELVSAGSCQHRQVESMIVYTMIFVGTSLFFVLTVAGDPEWRLDGCPMGQRGGESFIFNEDPDLRALFAKTHCWIAGLTAVATTVAHFHLVSTDLREFGVPQLPLYWFGVRLYVAFKASKLIADRTRHAEELGTKQSAAV